MGEFEDASRVRGFQVCGSGTRQPQHQTSSRAIPQLGLGSRNPFKTTTTSHRTLTLSVLQRCLPQWQVGTWILPMRRRRRTTVKTAKKLPIKGLPVSLPCQLHVFLLFIFRSRRPPTTRRGFLDSRVQGPPWSKSYRSTPPCRQRLTTPHRLQQRWSRMNAGKGREVARMDRARVGSHDSTGDNEAGGAGNSTGEAGTVTSPISAPDHRLGCPFFKRDPRRHSNHRSCSGPGWKTIHRVKYDLSSPSVPVSGSQRVRTESTFTDNTR